MQSRRDFLATLSAAGVASILGIRRSLADEAPPEVTTIRLRRDPSICVAPWYIAEDLLRAEGFTDIRYVPAQSGPIQTQMYTRGELDFGLSDPGMVVFRLDTGVPITALAGVHAGCFELFAHEPIRTISDLKGKKVGIDVLGSGKHRYVAVMAANVGLDPAQGHRMGRGFCPQPDGVVPHGVVRREESRCFSRVPPEPQELRARKIGRVILNTTTDQPWSQYFCCLLIGNREFVRDHPVATKRVVRALLKANDICASRAGAGRAAAGRSRVH